MGGKRRPISIARELAERQHGVFARRQLLARGIGADLVDHWLATHQVEVVQRAVYAFSASLLTRHGQYMAGVLTVGPDATLSHRSAAVIWRMQPQATGRVEITTERRPRRRPGLLLHCLPIAADEVTVHDGLPVTTPGRTLFDIAHRVRPQELERAVREADYLRLTGGPSLTELVERYPGRTGITAVKRLLARGWSASPTRSELEARFDSFIDRYGLPPAERNALIDLGTKRVEVDFLWRSARIVVELDGYAAHATRHGFEDDRERDRWLQLAGFIVIRVTWRQLHDEPSTLARDMRELISRRRLARAS